MQCCLLRIPVCLLLLLSLNTAAAWGYHPISHVDAWMRISDRIELRLIVFLDDVLRFQNPQLDHTGRVSAVEFRAAIDRHASRLLQQVQIFDATGSRLIGQLTEAPQLESLPDSVDPQADANLRLAWKFHFEIPNPAQTGSFTFLPRLNHPLLTSLPELRLHAAHLELRQRIDVVIPEGRPHTVRFRRSTPVGDASLEAEIGNALSESSIPSSESLIDPNAATSTWIISRRTLVHEFSAPLSLMSMLSEQYSTTVRNSSPPSVYTADHSVIDRDARETLRHTVETWFRQHVQLYGAGLRRVTAEPDIEVRFLPVQTTEADVALQQMPEPDPMNPLTTLVGVRVRYPGILTVQGLHVIWKEAPGNFDSISLNCVTPYSSQSLSLPLSRLKTADAEASAAAIELEFPEPPGSQLTGPVIIDAATVPWTIQEVWPTLRAELAAILLVAIAVFCSFRCVRRRRVKSLVSAVLLLLAAGLVVATDQRSLRIPDHRAAERIVQRLLVQVYQAGLIADAAVSVDQMSQVLSPDLVESLFVSIEQAFAGDERTAPAVQLRDVRVIDCFASEVAQAESQFAVECQWLVDGDVFHWGHLHGRRLLLHGRLQIQSDSKADLPETWKIVDLQLESVSVQDAVPVTDP